MPTNLEACARMLTKDGVRHHVDPVDGVIRAVFVTQAYVNPRGERLAVVRIDAPDDGHRCRASIARAFPAGTDPAATCEMLCRMAADTPAVGVEYDADEGLRLVVETIVEDGRLTTLQLLSMVDRVVEAAETWHAAIATPAATPHETGSRRRPAA